MVPCDLDVTQPSFSSLSVSTVWCTSFSLHDHQLLLSGPSFSMRGRWNRGSGKRGSVDDSNQRISTAQQRPQPVHKIIWDYGRISHQCPRVFGVLVLYKTAKFTRWRKTCCLLQYQTGADDRLFAQVTCNTQHLLYDCSLLNVNNITSSVNVLTTTNFQTMLQPSLKDKIFLIRMLPLIKK